MLNSIKTLKRNYKATLNVFLRMCKIDILLLIMLKLLKIPGFL